MGNALGAGDALRARTAIIVCLVSSAACATVYLTILGWIRNWWGCIFTNQTKNIARVADGIPVIRMMEALDCIQAVEAGIMRGAGMQKFGAICNFTFYCVIGLPLAAAACLWKDYGSKGIFSALSIGVVLQIVAFTLRICLLYWDKLAVEISRREADRRLCEAATITAVAEREKLSESFVH